MSRAVGLQHYPAFYSCSRRVRKHRRPMSEIASSPRPWRPLFPLRPTSTIPPNFVKLPDTAATPSTREFDIPTTYSRLVTKDLAVFFIETFRILEDSNRGTRSGFDNLVIGAQYQLYTNPEHHSSLPWVVRRRSAVPERPESPRHSPR